MQITFNLFKYEGPFLVFNLRIVLRAFNLFSLKSFYSYRNDIIYKKIHLSNMKDQHKFDILLAQKKVQNSYQNFIYIHTFRK